MKSIINVFIDFYKKRNKLVVITLLIGAVTYALMAINQLVNNLDGIWHGSVSVAGGWELSIGRWLWRYLDKARFSLSSDPMTTLITLFLYAMAVAFIIDIFEVDSLFSSVLYGMAFIISTGACAQLSFRYMSPTFGFSCFFSTLSVWLLVKFKSYLSIIPATLFIAFASGCYQADIGCTCLIILSYIIYVIINNKFTNKEILTFTLKSLVSGIAGTVLYYVILQIEFARYNVVFNDYNGASDYNIMGIIMNFPQRFLSTYYDFWRVFTNNTPTMRVSVLPSTVATALYVVAFVFFLAKIVVGLIPFIKEKEIIKPVVALVCFLLVPAACNVSLIIAYTSFISVQMIVPMMMVVTVLAAATSAISLKNLMGDKIAKCATVAIIAVIIYGQFFMVQYDQQAMYMGRQACLSLSTEIEAALSQYKMLHPMYKYVFVGAPSDNPLFYKNDFFGTANEYAQVGNFPVYPGNARMCWQGLWWYEKGIQMDFSSAEKWDEIYADPLVRDMPIFPERASYNLYKDVIVVKLSNTY